MRRIRRVSTRSIALSLASLLVGVLPAGAAEPASANAPKVLSAQALADMETLASKDDPTALVALAGVYQQGRGVPKDLPRAAALYQRAAELGNADAQFNLGNLYLLGEGVARDDDWAFTWFRAAARQGHALARHNVEEFYRSAGVTPPADLGGDTLPSAAAGTQPAPDSEQAQEHSAARHPQPVPEEPTPDELAALDLARSKGISVDAAPAEPAAPTAPAAVEAPTPSPDLAAARELLTAGKPLAALPTLETHAKAGNAEAQWMLAGVLATLKRTDYDLARSLQWLKKSAQGGWRDAQFALGGRYERGDGVDADEAEAISWYRSAARQGHPEALQRLRAIYRAAGVGMPPLDPAAPTAPATSKPSAGMDATDDARFLRAPASAHA